MCHCSLSDDGSVTVKTSVGAEVDLMMSQLSIDNGMKTNFVNSSLVHGPVMITAVHLTGIFPVYLPQMCLVRPAG